MKLLITLAAPVFLSLLSVSCSNAKNTEEGATAQPSQVATSAATKPTVTPLHPRSATPLPCENVLTQADIDALGANGKLTLPFDPCTAFERNPEEVESGYGNSPAVDFFVPAGTTIVAPWDGTLELYPLESSSNAGIYVADVSDASRHFRARIYMYQDGSDPGFNSLIAAVRRPTDVQRGDPVGFVGLPLPDSITGSGAAFELQLADWPGTNMLDPAHNDYWAGGQMNFYLLSRLH